MKIVLILGCQRSGTSLLASMVGRHKEISMLYESITDDTFKLIGKEYGGNKLLIPRQIQMHRRATKFGYLINRIINFHFFKYKYQKKRFSPSSKLCIQDYLDKDAKIIAIFRDKKSTLNSMQKRAGMSLKQAEVEYDQSKRLLEKLVADKLALPVNFEELLLKPEEILRAICRFLSLEFDERMLEGHKYNYIYPHKIIDVSKATVN